MYAFIAPRAGDTRNVEGIGASERGSPRRRSFGRLRCMVFPNSTMEEEEEEEPDDDDALVVILGASIEAGGNAAAIVFTCNNNILTCV